MRSLRLRLKNNSPAGVRAPEMNSSEIQFAKINRLLPNGRRSDRAGTLCSELR